MPFFLIGKTPEGSLYLISERPGETRADVLAELGRVTGGSDFAGWDDEVMVFDLETGVPVLLVRPAIAVEQQASTAPGSVEPPSADVADEDAGSGLRDALLRSTAQMEAEGIVAPESVGTPRAEAVEVEHEALQVEPEEAEVEGPGLAAREPELREASPDEPDPGAPPTVRAGDDSPEPAPAAWPWNLKEPSRPFSLDVLEEPGDDEESLVRAAGDDETMATAHPVVLDAHEWALQAEGSEQVARSSSGAGAERASEATTVEASIPIGPEPEPMEPVLTEGSATAEESLQPHEEPDSGVREALDFLAGVHAESSREVSELETPLVQADPAEPAESWPAEQASPSVISQVSDFIDLGPTPGSEPADTSFETMTCDDCVYVETCPNKDQRDPASCGSFQWK